MLMMKRFQDKVAIVMDSTKGTGFSIAKRLGMEGASVIVSSSKKDDLCKAIKELKSEDIEVLDVICDVLKAQHRKKLIKKILQKYKKIDVIVSNATVDPSVHGILKTQEESLLEKFCKISFKALILLLRDAAPHLQEGSSVVFVSSIEGNQPQASLPIYDVTKTVLIGLTEALATEISPNVRVNSVVSGSEPTHFADSITKDAYRAIMDVNTLQQIGNPSDIAAATAFLASSDASHISGETLVVAGGIRSNM